MPNEVVYYHDYLCYLSLKHLDKNASFTTNILHQ